MSTEKEEIHRLRQSFCSEPTAKEVYQLQKELAELSDEERHKIWRETLIADINRRLSRA
jgi:hypothetical protein